MFDLRKNAKHSVLEMISYDAITFNFGLTPTRMHSFRITVS